jgi:hypothetical protein
MVGFTLFIGHKGPYGEQRYSSTLFLDLGTVRGWGVSVTPQPLSTPGQDPVPIVQEAGWAPGPVRTGAEKLAPTRIRSPTVQPIASRYTDWATRPLSNKRNLSEYYSKLEMCRPKCHKLNQGSTNIPKILEPPPNSRCQKGDKEVPYWGPIILQWPVNLPVDWYFLLYAMTMWSKCRETFASRWSHWYGHILLHTPISSEEEGYYSTFSWPVLQAS